MDMRKIDDKRFWILLIISGLSLITFLGCAYFNTKGEPREAVVSLSMLKYGNWILPVNNGTDIAYKPPLLHWCIALLSAVGGGVSELSARLPSALSLMAMVLMGYLFFARRISRNTAFVAALITLSCFEIHRSGTQCRVDMLLSAFIVMALYRLHSWGERGMRGIPLTAVIFMSCAFLTKGPVGILLPCMVEFVFLWIRRGCTWRSFLRITAAALAACVAPALWYAAAYMQGGNHFLLLVYEENVLRFLGKMTYASHVKPVYYNFLTLAAGYMPYTLLLITSLFGLRRVSAGGKTGSMWNKAKTYIKTMDDSRLFSLLSIVLIFVFYCIPKSKRSVYLLPIYPFIAVFIADYIIRMARSRRLVVNILGSMMSCVALLMPILLLCLRHDAVAQALLPDSLDFTTSAIVGALQTEHIRIADIAIIMMPVMAAAVFAAVRKREGLTPVYSITGINLAIFFALDGFYLPTVLNAKSDKGVAMTIKHSVPDGTIYSYMTDIVEGNPMRPFTINFYLGDRVIPFEAEHPDSGYMIAGGNDVEKFKQTYKQYDVKEVINFNHRSCDDKKMLHMYRFYKAKTDVTTAEYTDKNKKEYIDWVCQLRYSY